LAAIVAAATDDPAVDHFTLPTVAGEKWSLDDARGQKAVVLAFLSWQCPVSNNYVRPLIDIEQRYAERGVRVVAIHSADDADDEDVASVAANVREAGIRFPALRDDGARVAARLGVEVTPEVVVLDSNRVVRYRGRIDDQYSDRLRRNPVIKSQDLVRALDELLAGKPVSVPRTKAVGCPIVSGATETKPTGSVTFNRDVMPILQKHCQTCHRPGESGPFSLMSYRQAARWGKDIRDFTADRRMPPWKVVHGFGEFAQPRRLSDSEIATIAAWVDGGMPEGNPADLPRPRQFVSGWQLGEPDLVLTPKADFEIAATGRDTFRWFVLPTGLTEDQWVRAVELRPGNGRIVHHTVYMVDSSGRAQQLDDADPLPGYSRMGPGFAPSGGLGGWAAGQPPFMLPAAAGFFLPRNAAIVMQVHYHPTGKPERDRSSIGLYFAREKVEKQFLWLPVVGMWPLSLGIPAGADNYRVTGTFRAPFDGTLLTVFPHMHTIGKDIKLTMTPPNGGTRPLIWIQDWDYNWQESYVLKEPIPFLAGTRFDLEAHFDNSAKNPNNPNDPPKFIRWGQQTTDEMCFGFIGVTAENVEDLRRLVGRRWRTATAPGSPSEAKPAPENSPSRPPSTPPTKSGG
jgi:peroxiredoxin/mono/diheme cytochrome c family protein